MRSLAIIFLLIMLSVTGLAQQPGSQATEKPNRSAAAAVKPDENQQFQNARTNPIITERIAALMQFVQDYPKSSRKTFALELISSSRAELGDQKLRLSDFENGINLFKLAVSESPTPVSEKLYTEILINLPTNLLFRGQSRAAFEVAALIEEKVAGNANQLLGLAGFYLGTEQASEAKRIAEKAIALEPGLPAAYQTLGMANRINFDLETSVASYAEALRLDPNSLVSKNSLAEMKRATGKPDEAAALYREVLSARPDDGAAETGLILSLFDQEKRADAEAAMTASLQKNPGNLFLLVGAAYWYAAHGEGTKAVELAERAVAYEPRYTWAHIALARGLMQQNKPLEAERTLLLAKQYGNFPTLNYEIASARMAAGFFREASDELKTSFSLAEGMIATNLGGRIPKSGRSFKEILDLERRASIFQPRSADDDESAETLKSLFEFARSLDGGDERQLDSAVDNFVRGNDNMRTHRRLYAAKRLLEKRTALPKALELTGAAGTEIGTALDVVAPVAAVMADELYESRTLAITRNEVLIIPDVPRLTLSRILRGRIEELSGWALIQQEKPGEAEIRLKRAVTILPENSIWWRSSQWRLGDALDTEGKTNEALKAYLAGYNKEVPDQAKRIVVESVYRRATGSIEGLEHLIGAKSSGNQVGASLPEAVDEAADTAEAPPLPPQPDESKEQATPSQRSDSLALPTRNPTVARNVIPKNVPVERPGAEPVVTPPSNTAASKPAAEVPSDVPIAKPLGQTDTGLPAATIAEKRAMPKIPENVPMVAAERGRSVEPAITPDDDPDAAPTRATDSKEGIMIAAEPKSDKTETEPREAAQKSLFEPIVITLPGKNRVERIVPAAAPDEKPVEPPIADNIIDKTINEEAKPDEVPPARTDSPVATRPRKVPVAIFTEPAGEPAICRLIINPESMALLSDGGSLGVFVGFEGPGELSKVTAISASPSDVTVFPLTDVAVLTERLFFIVKSVSPNVGLYKITFDSPCGTKDLAVTIR